MKHAPELHNSPGSSGLTEKSELYATLSINADECGLESQTINNNAANAARKGKMCMNIETMMMEMKMERERNIPESINLGAQAYPVHLWRKEHGRIWSVFTCSTALPPDYMHDEFAESIDAYIFNGREFFLVLDMDQEIFWSLHEGCRVFLHTAPIELRTLQNVGGDSFNLKLHESSITDCSIYRFMLQHQAVRFIPGDYIFEQMSKAYFCWVFFVKLSEEVPFWDPGGMLNGGEKPEFGTKEGCSC